MSESAILALFDVIIKVLPSCVSFIEGLVGDGGTITPDHVPQILSHMADVSKTATDLSNTANAAASVADDAKSMVNDAVAQ